MKFRSSYVNRIERIQKWINDNPGVHVNDMLDEFSDTPRGTVSALLSFMLRAGHVVRGTKGYYSLPELIASPKSVALDILKQNKAPNLFNHAKRRKGGSMPQIAPIEIESVTNRNQLPQVITPTPADEIMRAIELLKSQGYKILKSKNEWSEV
jgi:hypothetical protein